MTFPYAKVVCADHCPALFRSPMHATGRFGLFQTAARQDRHDDVSWTTTIGSRTKKSRQCRYQDARAPGGIVEGLMDVVCNNEVVRIVIRRA